MKANLVILNGIICSLDMNMNRHKGTAVAVSDGKIIATGLDQEIKQYITDSTKIIDAEGNSILPGLCDAHTHPSCTASTNIACDLFDIAPKEKQDREDIMEIFRKRIRNYIDENPEMETIHGTGWNLGLFPGNGWELPNRHDLDQIQTEKPIILTSFCQHNLWVNTKAIELAGITANVITPENGSIPRENSGYPSGLFMEWSAMALISENLANYDFSIEQYMDAIRYYQKHLANKYGITLVGEMLFTENAREAYKKLAQSQELTLRVRGVYEISHDDYENKFADVVGRKGQDNVNDLFEINTIKVFMEGEPCMCEPFEEAITASMGLPSDYKGKTFWPHEDSDNLFTSAMKEGFQLHLHAMGDQSVKQSLASLKTAQKQYGDEGRNTIAHLMAIKPEDIEEGGKLKLIASCQPRWMVCDVDIEEIAIPYFSEKRCYDFYPNKRLRNAGWVMAYGTDYPVTLPPNPFHGIQCGMTRTLFPDTSGYESYKGRVLGPEDNKKLDTVTLEESIQSLTINGAYQFFLENVTGSIEVGKSADLVILKCDIEEIPADQIYSVEVANTIFKGETVYQG